MRWVYCPAQKKRRNIFFTGFTTKALLELNRDFIYFYINNIKIPCNSVCVKNKKRREKKNQWEESHNAIHIELIFNKCKHNAIECMLLHSPLSTWNERASYIYLIHFFPPFLSSQCIILGFIIIADFYLFIFCCFFVFWRNCENPFCLYICCSNLIEINCVNHLNWIKVAHLCYVYKKE